MFGLSKKKGSGPPGPPAPRIPTDKVVSLSSQGLSEPEIIKSLREQGFTPLEVDRAMKDALRAGSGVQARGPPGGAMAPPPGPPAPPTAGPVSPAPAGPPAPPEPIVPPAPTPPPVPEPPGGAEPIMPPGPPEAPAPQPQQGEQPWQPFPQGGQGRNQFAPTIWDDDDEDDMADDDMMDLPQERRFGPKHVMSEMDEDLPPMPGPGKEEKPLPFAKEPLPKDRDERSRELRDRRRREVEELTEEITNEKWSEMIKKVQDIEERIDGMEASVKSAATAAPGTGAPSVDLEDIKQDIQEQKRGIEDANARIDSLEEVVKGSLTPMVESIRKFSHAVKTSKGGQAPDVSAPQPTEVADQAIQPMPAAQVAPPEPPPATVPEATGEPAPSGPAGPPAPPAGPAKKKAG